MSTKPPDQPRWSTDASNESEPVEGLKDSGWGVDAVPSSGNINWLLRTIYLWCLYLSEGEFEGAASFADPVDFGSDVIIQGETSLGDTGVTGELVVSGDVTVGGELNFGPRVRSIPAAAAQPDVPNSMTFGGFFWNFESETAAALHYPIELNTGDRILGWKVYVSKATTSGYMRAQVFSYNNVTGTAAQIGTQVTNSASNPGRVTLTASAQDLPIEADTSYRLVVWQDNASADNSSTSVEVTYDHPP